MLDAVAKIISEAEAAKTFPDTKQLEQLFSYFQDGSHRVSTISCIAKNVSTIVSDTAQALFLDHSYITNPGGSAYSKRQVAACLRDLEIILRYISYAVMSRDIAVIYGRCLNGLRETYQALEVPLDSMALSIGIMKFIVIKFVTFQLDIEKNEFTAEIATYFDHIILDLGGSIDDNKAIRALENLETLRNQSVQKPVELIHASWESLTYSEWLNQDKLVQKIQEYDNVDDPLSIEESATDFFESWKQLPANLKYQVWREREIMAALYEKMMTEWKNVKGFSSIAVARRIIDSKTRLAGIIVFDSPVSENYYHLFNLPTCLQVQSSIQSLQKEEESVPILLEWMATSTPLNGDIIEVESPSLEALPTLTTPTMQSGDCIAGCKLGFVNFEQAVTLTTFVTPRGSTIRTAADVRILTVHHGFRCGYTKIYSCQLSPAVEIGEVVYNSHVQKELAQKLDVSLIKPREPLLINPLLKSVPVVPKPPAVATAGMLVQMYGGVSGHQTGYVDYSCFMNLGPASSVIPNFTAQIRAQPGDSGSLLVIGNETGDPFPDAANEGYSEEWLEATRFAMLGMLTEGATGTYQNVTIFRPIVTIFQQLKLQAAYSTNEYSLSTERFQPHAKNNKYTSTNEK